MVAIILYAVLVVVVTASGTFRQIAVLATAGTLLLYLIACLSVLRLRTKGVAGNGTPFVAPGADGERSTGEQDDLVLPAAECKHTERRIGVAGAAERATDGGLHLIEHGVGVSHPRAMISAGHRLPDGAR